MASGAAGSGPAAAGGQLLLEAWVSCGFSGRQGPGSGLDCVEAAVSGVGRGGPVSVVFFIAVSVGFWRSGASSSSG